MATIESRWQMEGHLERETKCLRLMGSLTQRSFPIAISQFNVDAVVTESKRAKA